MDNHRYTITVRIEGCPNHCPCDPATVYVTAPDKVAALTQASPRIFTELQDYVKYRTVVEEVDGEPPWSAELLQKEHTFKHVEDSNDQLAVCEIACRLFYAFRLEPRENATIGYLLENLINKDDEYMGDELISLFEDTIWPHEVR